MMSDEEVYRRHISDAVASIGYAEESIAGLLSVTDIGDRESMGTIRMLAVEASAHLSEAIDSFDTIKMVMECGLDRLEKGYDD